MTIEEARTQLAAMLGAATIPDATLTAALQQSLTWDAAGLSPGQPGYVESYDLHWAAAEVCTLQAMADMAAPTPEQVKSFTSEGTTIQVDGGMSPDWWRLAHLWRLRSPMARLAGYGSTLNVIDVPSDGGGYVPTSDGLRGGAW